MQNLQGLEFSDFETKGNIILGKVEVDKDGSRNFTELEGVTRFDIQSNITNLFLKTCAKTFNIELLNTDDEYSLFDKGKSKYDHIRQGRRCKLYIGIQKEVEVESTEYSASQENEISVSGDEEDISAINYCDSDDWWGYWNHPVVGTCCSGNKWVAMLRMLNLEVPQGAIIDSAVFEANGYEWDCDGSTEDIKIEIQAEKTINAEQIDSQEDHEDRELTTAKLEQTIPYSSANVRTSFDVTDVIQEIVNQEGWESGNAINLHFAPQDDNPVGLGWDFDFGTDYGRDATLTVTYRTSSIVTSNENQDFHWSWIYGIIDNVTTSKSADGEMCNISGRDYVAYLSENYLKNLWWGKQGKYSIIANKEKYNMPSDCKGIYKAYKYNIATQEYDEIVLNSEYTYDWEKNQFVFLHPNVPYQTEGSIWVWYFTSQIVENVVADLLIEAGLLTHSDKQNWLTGDLVTATGKTIDRVWFESGTTYMHAIELLAERVIYRFRVNPLGQPMFTRIPVLLTDTTKRLNREEYIVRNIEERLDELYNHFYLVGEKRAMKKINLGVMSNGVEDITHNSATLLGTVLADGETSAKHRSLFGGTSIITQKGFKWKKEGEAEQVYSSASSTMGLFTKELTNLDPDSRYSWLVWAKNNLGHYAESNWNTFVTPGEE